MDKHDRQEIEKLKEFGKWVIWYRSLTNEEKKEYHKNRWKGDNKLKILTAARESILRDMHTYMIEQGDEELYEEWITGGVPDEPSEEDFHFIACNDDDWMEICTLFGSLTQKEEME